VKTHCVIKSVFIFPINLRTAKKYFFRIAKLEKVPNTRKSSVFQLIKTVENRKFRPKWQLVDLGRPARRVA
jgi:hypothetical protein